MTFSAGVFAPGQKLRLAVRVNLEGPPVSMNLSLHVDPRSAGGPVAAVMGGVIAPGPRTVAFEYVVSNPAPPRICFSVYADFPGRPMSPAPLVQGACLVSRLELEQAGTARRARFGLTEIFVTGVKAEPVTLQFGENEIWLRPLTVRIENGHLDYLKLWLEARAGHPDAGRPVSAASRVGKISGQQTFGLPDVIVTKPADRWPDRLCYDVTATASEERGEHPQPLLQDLCLANRLHVLDRGTGLAATVVAPPDRR